MKALRKDSAETRRRLLQAAGEVFAAKGFRDATTAEICRKANANVAAVNYHFGSKQALYVEAWRHSFQRSLKAHPPDGGVGPEAAAEERLRGRILSLMQRMSDPDNHEFEIMHKELVNPTGLLSEVMLQSIEPIRQGLRAVVQELLGAGATEQQVRLCQMSIRAQCFDPMFRKRRNRKAPGRPGGVADTEARADHITRFSLAGIRSVRREIEEKEVQS